MLEKAGRNLKVAFVASVLAAMLATAPAQAGRYHVYSCRTPTGEVAPTDGWSGSVPTGGPYDDYALNTCAQGGALVAALGDASPHTALVDQATWAFAAPAGETIAGGTLWRAGDTVAGGATATYEFWLAGPAETNIVSECVFTLGCGAQGDLGAAFAEANRVVMPSASLGPNLYVSAGCAAGFGGDKCESVPGDASGYDAAVHLYAADLILEDSVAPVVTAVGSELASETTLEGTRDLSFTAADSGSGVWEAVVSVDGQVMQTTPLDENGGHCRDVRQDDDGLPAFLYVQPCAPSLSADIGVDTTTLANGSHHLLVDVLDAAGNATAVIDRTVTVYNPPPACAGVARGASSSSAAGILRVSWRGSKRPGVTSAWGSSPAVLGRLTNAQGAPIPAAAIALTGTPAGAGQPSVAMTGSQTARDGRFKLRIPATGSSRRLCFIYHPPSGAPALVATLELRTRAGIALRVSPRTSSVGQSIRFRGHLRGGPIPASGKALILEARSPGGRWIEFDVIHTGPRGGFTAGYRFRFPGPASYQFRVLSEAEGDYPYAEGSSNVVGVFER
jgi:hypothetical protein